MNRGKQKLYNNIIPQSLPKNGEEGKRNTALEERRDAMAHRYYFHANICRLRYDDCLMALSNEFFLQPNTIYKELELRLDLINQLVNTQTTTAELRKKYTFFNWVGKLL